MLRSRSWCPLAIAIAVTACAASQTRPDRPNASAVPAAPAVAASPPIKAEAARPPANARPTEPIVIARDLIRPSLLGTAGDHVYWLNHAPDPDAPEDLDMASGDLARAPKTGGASETLFEAASAKVECGIASAGNQVFLVGPGNHTVQAIWVVRTDREYDKAAIFREGVSACHLVMSRGRLFWTEEGPRDRPPFFKGPADPNDAPHASLHSAKVDGSDERLLWKSDDDVAPRWLAAHGEGLVLLVSPPVPNEGIGLGNFGGMGLGGMGRDKARADATPQAAARSSVMIVPQDGGASRAVWSTSGQIRFAGTDGSDDLMVCAEDDGGLYRVPLAGHGQPSRVVETACDHRLRAWNGWSLRETRAGAGRATLEVARLAPPRTPAASWPVVAAPPPGFIVQGDSLYACVVGPKQADGRCDLLRVDSSWLESRATAPARPAP
jgi:hypothetical protein